MAQASHRGSSGLIPGQSVSGGHNGIRPSSSSRTQVSPFSIIPTILHTHSFIYHSFTQSQQLKAALKNTNKKEITIKRMEEKRKYVSPVVAVNKVSSEGIIPYKQSCSFLSIHCLIITQCLSPARATRHLYLMRPDVAARQPSGHDVRCRSHHMIRNTVLKLLHVLPREKRVCILCLLFDTLELYRKHSINSKMAVLD